MSNAHNVQDTASMVVIPGQRAMATRQSRGHMSQQELLDRVWYGHEQPP